MKLLKIGGKIVYSTCSLNPVENEAVVLEIWRQARGAIRLVDVSQQFPDLSRGNGLSSWVVTDAENHVIPAENADSMEHSAVKRSFFPPSDAERADAPQKSRDHAYRHREQKLRRERVDREHDGHEREKRDREPQHAPQEPGLVAPLEDGGETGQQGQEREDAHRDARDERRDAER